MTNDRRRVLELLETALLSSESPAKAASARACSAPAPAMNPLRYASFSFGPYATQSAPVNSAFVEFALDIESGRRRRGLHNVAPLLERISELTAAPRAAGAAGGSRHR